LQEDRFYILSCPHCGNFQIKEIRNIQIATFKCLICNKSRKIISKGTFNVKSYGNFTCNQATEEIKSIKSKES